MVDSFYKSNDYIIGIYFTDGDFDCLENAVEGMTLHIPAKNEHAGDIGRVVQTVKDRIHAIRKGLPFCILPSGIIINLVAFVLMWLNAFPRKEASPPPIATCNIILGSQLDCNKHCRLSFGAYAQVQDDLDPLNVMDVAHILQAYVSARRNSRGS